MKWKMLLVAFVSVYGGGLAIAEDAKPTGEAGLKELSKVEREKMATAHEKMAACLRSDKTWTECHDEMRGFCQENRGAGSCPMWEKGPGWGRGKGAMRKGARSSN